MCKIMEEYADEVAREEVLRANRQALIKGFRNGGLTRKTASVMFPNLKPSEIEAIFQEAKRSARGRRPAKRS